MIGEYKTGEYRDWFMGDLKCPQCRVKGAVWLIYDKEGMRYRCNRCNHNWSPVGELHFHEFPLVVEIRNDKKEQQ